MQHIQQAEAEETRPGDWMPTFTGGRVWPLDPRPEEIRIEDLAHQLALINRWGGRSLVPISVAQHSVMVCRLCPNYPLDGLLHDGHEGVLGVDVPRPIKNLFPAWREMEQRIQREAICPAFGLQWPVPEEVEIADEVLLATEARDFSSIEQDVRTWKLAQPPLALPLCPWPWEEAERRFLQVFRSLTHAAARRR